jgi:hypothetical protein
MVMADDLQQKTQAVEQNTEQAQEHLRDLKALAEAVEAANRQQTLRPLASARAGQSTTSSFSSWE